jgi:hypothetical protein
MPVDATEEMAARLFAELFYKQHMAEREQKRQGLQTQQFDRNKTKVYNQTNDEKTDDN